MTQNDKLREQKQNDIKFIKYVCLSLPPISSLSRLYDSALNVCDYILGEHTHRLQVYDVET